MNRNSVVHFRKETKIFTFQNEHVIPIKPSDSVELVLREGYDDYQF